MKFPKIKFKFKKPITKWMLLIGAAILVIFGTVIGISSCNRTSYFQLVLDNLSETRLYMKTAQNDSYRVQFFAGMREEPYTVNGISEKKVAFGIVNLEPRNKVINIDVDEIEGTLQVGDENIPLVLERNPHGTNFAADIEKLVDADKVKVLTAVIGGVTQTFELSNAMPEDAINWERALEIATDHSLTHIKKAGKFEAYIKIVESPVAGAGSFWYIRFVPEKGENFFVVIDPSGNIIS
jgi:hypothetical protein